MFPDRWGSDYDYDTAMGHGAEPEDWCHEHQQRGSTCGPCVSRELSASDVLGAALVVMLDKIEGGAA
jgi:hypothetical protein